MGNLPAAAPFQRPVAIDRSGQDLDRHQRRSGGHTRFAYARDGALVFAVDYNGVHCSTDGGATWQTFNGDVFVGTRDGTMQRAP